MRPLSAAAWRDFEQIAGIMSGVPAAPASSLSGKRKRKVLDDPAPLGKDPELEGFDWHVEMLNDRRRNTAFSRALTRAVDASGGHTSVLEVGAGGTALLSLMAKAAGADKCVAIECDPAMAERAREVVAANGHTPATVQVVAAHSYDLRRGAGHHTERLSVHGSELRGRPLCVHSSSLAAKIRGVIIKTYIRLVLSPFEPWPGLQGAQERLQVLHHGLHTWALRVR